MFRGGSKLGTSSMAKIVKPLDFTALKGHTVDKERAIQSQMRFNNDYIVR